MAVFNIIKLSELELQNRIDSEFYSPEYMDIMKNLRELDFLKVCKCCFVKSGSTPPERDPQLKNGTVLLKTANIREGYIDIDSEEPFFIDETCDEKLKSSRLQTNDVLINIVGATHEVIGRVALVPSDFPKANITQAMSLIRLKTLDFLPEYIFAFLYSRYGRKQVCRIARPTAQYNLNNKETNSIIIPKISEKVQNKIRNIWNKFYDFYRESIYLYEQSKELLLKELGLKEFKPKYDLSYTVNLSETFSVNRVDAEYFQPAYEAIINKMKEKTELQPFGKFILFFQKGIEVGSDNYIEEGKPFIRVSNLSITGLIERDQKYIDEELYKQLKTSYEPKLGDFLLTKDATPGIAYVVKEPIKGIISSGILKLKIDDNEVDKEYLALYCNTVGKMLIERDGGGSVIIHWKPEQVRELKIPIIPLEIQNKISVIVQQSQKARKRAEELLRVIKKSVEITIEKNEKEALNYINSYL